MAETRDKSRQYRNIGLIYAGTHDFDLDLDAASEDPREGDEDSHANDKPELLLAPKVVGSGVPVLAWAVVPGLIEDNEDPGRHETRPADEAVPPLERAVASR